MKSKLIHRIWLASLLLAAPSLTLAQTSLIFERATIQIQAKPKTEAEAAAPPRTIAFSVEVRPEDAMRLEYIHTLNTLTPTTGVMIHFAAPTIVALPDMKVYTPVDALFIADDGSVLQILPNVILGEMPQEIHARTPISAFLFLKAGEAAKRGIQSRDIVSGKMFTPAPAIQE